MKCIISKSYDNIYNFADNKNYEWYNAYEIININWFEGEMLCE